MAESRRFRADALRSLAFGSIGAAFAVVGTAFNAPMRQLLLQNLTDVNVIFSFTGNTDHILVPAGSFFLNDVMANEWATAGFFITQGTQMFVRQEVGAPTTGNVYISAFFAA